MATSRGWRQTLLGSLQGQLQLATYLAVFIGFTGASSAGLWIGQRNLIQNDLRELRDSADSIQQCLRKGGGDDASVRQELLLHSGMRTSLWIEQPDGSLLLPESDHVSISDQTIRAAMAANQKRTVGLQQQLRLGENQYLSELVERFPSGARLWISHEVSSNQQALSHYLGLMILIWGSCLIITLIAVSALVRRIVQPLQQLNAATNDVTAETLASARLTLKHGPIEVLQLGRTYNALLERLSQSWELQRQFVSTVSHELRTPLTIVQGYLHRTIRRSDNLSSGQLKGLQTAEDESIRMRRLLDDLLDLSRSDSGRLSISHEPIEYLVPGKNYKILHENIKKSEEFSLVAIILVSFGIGNGPVNDETFMHAINLARSKQINVFNVTQCLEGRVNEGDYATGSGLKDAGVIGGKDMTIEAAYSKGLYLTSKHPGQYEVINEFFQKNLRGELRVDSQALFDPLTD